MTPEGRVGREPLERIAPLFYRMYMGLVYLTSRKRYEGFDGLWRRLEGGEKVVVALLHQNILLAPYIYRGGGVLTMVSRSRDGEMIASALEGLGFRVVRGSSSRGGKEALRTIIRLLQEDGVRAAALAVDGPRGPAGRVKPGVLFIARKSGLPLYPIGCGVRRRVLLRNWDRTLIPLPFNAITFRCGEPMFLKEEGDMEGACKELERRLKGLQGRV